LRDVRRGIMYHIRILRGGSLRVRRRRSLWRYTSRSERHDAEFPGSTAVRGTVLDRGRRRAPSAECPWQVLSDVDERAVQVGPPPGRPGGRSPRRRSSRPGWLGRGRDALGALRTVRGARVLFRESLIVRCDNVCTSRTGATGVDLPHQPRSRLVGARARPGHPSSGRRCNRRHHRAGDAGHRGRPRGRRVPGSIPGRATQPVHHQSRRFPATSGRVHGWGEWPDRPAGPASPNAETYPGGRIRRRQTHEVDFAICLT